MIDNGIGDEKGVKTLFEKFSMIPLLPVVSGELTWMVEVKNLVEAFNGKIDVSSVLGQGTTTSRELSSNALRIKTLAKALGGELQIAGK